jgi:Na+(H+)/acetate symporter ActP
MKLESEFIISYVVGCGVGSSLMVVTQSFFSQPRQVLDVIGLTVLTCMVVFGGMFAASWLGRKYANDN